MSHWTAEWGNDTLGLASQQAHAQYFGFIKETDDYKGFKKELKLFLLLHTFYSVEESVSS